MCVDLSEERICQLSGMAVRMRKMGLDMALAAGEKGAHIGGGFSCMELMAVLYGAVLRVDAHHPLDPDRDRLLISKNHCTLAHFPALVEKGFLTGEEILNFHRDGSRLVGYPYRPELGLEYSGGSLGMALSVGIGQALSGKKRGAPFRVYVLVGDGELNEGSVWEGILAAPHFQLDRLTLLVDRNHLCYDGGTEEVMPLGDLPAKLRSFGWEVLCCDGHSVKSLAETLLRPSDGRPRAVVCDTVKGKGLPFAEGRPEWHQHSLTREQYEEAVAVLMEGGRV